MSERDESAAVANEIRSALGLGDGLVRFSTGSVPVFAVGGEHVVKLFPESGRSYFECEVAALGRVEGALSVPTPRVVSTGERRGWWYVAMTRLPGIVLSEAWPDIGAHDRRRLMQETGAAVAELHALSTEALAPLAVDWPAFVDAQRASCRERQVSTGLDPFWVDGIDEFLARWTPRDDGRRALLHTEIMREHLLVEPADGGWRLSGLFDFEPAMVGAPEYEFSSIAIFVASAEPGLLGALLDAYGAEVDDELPLRIMAYSLLHRYSSLRWYVDRLGVPENARDLDALARAWFTP